MPECPGLGATLVLSAQFLTRRQPPDSLTDCESAIAVGGRLLTGARGATADGRGGARGATADGRGGAARRTRRTLVGRPVLRVYW